MTDLTTPHFATPMTVIRDDAYGLVAWLPVGTAVLRAARSDGLGKRDDRRTLFTGPVVQEPGEHAVYHQLRVALTGRAWSVWVLFTAGTAEFAGWYVNLERPHVRDARCVYTTDHVLDVVVAADRTVVRKDEDELALAVEQGVFDVAEAAGITADAAAVEALVARWASPFCDGWERFRPDPAWPVPDLPEISR